MVFASSPGWLNAFLPEKELESYEKQENLFHLGPRRNIRRYHLEFHFNHHFRPCRRWPRCSTRAGFDSRRDAEGFLYFIGREDEMIKSSGYRISPTEVEDALYATQQVGEAAAFGVPHPRLGHAIVVVVTAPVGATVDVASLERSLRDRLPVYMVPTRIEVRDAPLPRNPNGKIDRRALASTLEIHTPAAT